MATQEKEFGVHHWDTFDNETLLLFQSDSMDEIEEFIIERYKAQGRVAASGADVVEVITKSGKCVKRFNVC